MGIIVKQSIKGNLWSYAGVMIGFVTTTWLYPEFLSTELVGLLGIFVSVSAITSQLCNLGINGVTSRLFPYFRNKDNGHNGFLFLALMIQTIGFLMFILIYYLFRRNMIELNMEKSAILADYIDLIIPLTFFTLLFIFFETYNRVLYDSVSGTFLQEFAQRVLILVFVLLYAFRVLDLNQFILSYVAALSMKGILLFFLLCYRGEINFRPQPAFLNKKLAKEIANVALFSVLGGVGSSLTLYIDKPIINYLLNLSDTGIYTIAFFFRLNGRSALPAAS